MSILSSYLKLSNKTFFEHLLHRKIETHFRLNASLQLLNSSVPCLAWLGWREDKTFQLDVSLKCEDPTVCSAQLGILNLGYLFPENKTMYSINLKLIWKIHKASWTPHYRGGSPGPLSTSHQAGNEEVSRAEGWDWVLILWLHFHYWGHGAVWRVWVIVEK